LRADSKELTELQSSLQKASNSYKKLQTSRDIWRGVGIAGGLLTVLTVAAAITLDALDIQLIE
jgi:hypothetical protein